MCILPSSFDATIRIAAITLAMLLPPSVASAETATPFIGKSGATPGEGVLPERFALLVGINRYDTTSTLGLNDLSNAENDAEGVASELHEAGFTTFVLTTGRKIKATPNEPPYVMKNEILNKLSTLINYASKSRERTGRPPIILFYFAGHGLNLDGNDYILPSNFKPSFAEDVPVMGISISEIANRISWAEPTLRIIISDACRTRSPGTLVKRSTGGETANFEPGNKNTRLVGPAKPKGINDTFLAFATLGDQAAADAGEHGAHGKFAGAFITVLSKARAKARQEGADGNMSTANEILQRTKQMMDFDTSSMQASQYAESATSFVFHPTKADFDLEASVWARAKKYTVVDGEEEAIRKAFYCNFKQFILQTSYYSYFGTAALDRMRRYEGGAVECEYAELKTTASESNDVKFLKSLEGGWVAKVPESGRPLDVMRAPADQRSHVDGSFNVGSAKGIDEHLVAAAQFHSPMNFTADLRGHILAQFETAQPTRKEQTRKIDDLRIKDLGALEIDPLVLAEVARFDPEARVDDLAVASADLGLYADTKLTRRIGEIRAGDLLQVLRIVDPDTINVRTSQLAANGSSKSLGQSGFVKQRPVDSGRVAVKFRAAVDLPNTVVYDTPTVDPILRSSVQLDMQVRFPSKDRLLGFARAQIAADKFAPASPIADRTVRRFVPSILPSSNEREQSDESVWIVTTLLPLSRDIRLRFLSSSGISVRPEDAVDLSGMADAGAPVVVVNGAAQLPSECISAAEESVRSMKGKVTAYVQFVLDAQRSNSELVRHALNAGGFYTPAAEKVLAVPKTSEVRVCADQNSSAAVLARELLERCKFGRFTPREIPACRKRLPRDAIEILLVDNAFE
jgi:hypothetical protein